MRNSVPRQPWAGLPPGTTAASIRLERREERAVEVAGLGAGTIASSTIFFASPSLRYRSLKPEPVTSVAWPCFAVGERRVHVEQDDQAVVDALPAHAPGVHDRAPVGERLLGRDRVLSRSAR